MRIRRYISLQTFRNQGVVFSCDSPPEASDNIIIYVKNHDTNTKTIKTCTNKQ